MEAIVYACQRFERLNSRGERLAFFIGDGAGVGKGRELAGIILENWLKGHRKMLWLSVSSDLKMDAHRDLVDVGADDIPLHMLSKLQYGDLTAVAGVKDGVLFTTYASLIATKVIEDICRLQLANFINISTPFSCSLDLVLDQGRPPVAIVALIKFSSGAEVTSMA